MNPKIIIVVFFFTMQLTVRGQVNFPLNTSGKIEISDVVIDSVKKEDLYALASTWFETLKKNTTVTMKTIRRDSINGNISGDMEFSVFYQSGVIQKVLGSVTCKLEIDVKDYKYRYRYTDFVFHEYKQDRYYRSLPTGKTKMLEEPEALGWQKNWEHCKSATNTKITNQIIELKQKMIPVKVAAVALKKKVDW